MKEIYDEKVIDEMVEMIRNNIELYYRNSKNYFCGLRNYCQRNNDKENKISYNQLLFLVEEALAELINCEFLYDFRTME